MEFVYQSEHASSQCPLQDIGPNNDNHTLVVGNGGQRLPGNAWVVSGWGSGQYDVDGGRSWLTSNDTDWLEEVYVAQDGHLAFHPSLTK